MRQKYCCPNLKKYVKAKKIIKNTINNFSRFRIKGIPYIFHCPFCGKYIPSKDLPFDIHTDFINPKSRYKDDHVVKMGKRPAFCCSRFNHAVKEGRFVFAYVIVRTIDETQWIDAGGYHIYYCPYCGTYIKGEGYGFRPKPYNK